MNTLRKIAENFNKNIKVLYEEPMSNHTTFKVGGKADVFFEPHTIEELEQIAACLKENSQSFFVLGGGSNLVVETQPNKLNRHSRCRRFSQCR